MTSAPKFLTINNWRGIDITGQRFAHLTVLGLIERRKNPNTRHHTLVWLCRCDCGTEVRVRSHHIRRGSTQSCGCKSNQRRREGPRFIHGHGSYKCGPGGSYEYRTWAAMRKRCGDTRHKSYPRYGGRGVTVCARWLTDFTVFLADMGLRPTPQHSLDRIDNNGNYAPTNCRWATKREQAENRRDNHLITAFGRTQPLSVWAREVGTIRPSTIRNRLRRGLSPEDALCAERWGPLTSSKQGDQHK